MTLQMERLTRPETTAAAGNPVRRGGSYVTLPVEVEASPRFEGSYITLPGATTGNGSSAQGSYVTLHSAPLGETEISYTRLG